MLTQAACSILPVICPHWLSPAIVNLVTLHSGVRFKHLKGVGQTPAAVLPMVPPQAAAASSFSVFVLFKPPAPDICRAVRLLVLQTFKMEVVCHSEAVSQC